MAPVIEPVIALIAELVIKPVRIGHLVPASGLTHRLERDPVCHPLTDLDRPEPAQRLLAV